MHARGLPLWCAAHILAGSWCGIAAPASPPPAPGPCVAVMMPTIEGIQGSATDLGTAARELIVSFLTGPSLKAVPLEARLPSQAIEEARLTPCTYVLTATITGKRRGKNVLGQIAGQAAGNAAWQIPYGGSIGATVAGGVARSAAQAVSALASSTRTRDELRLEHRLATLDKTVVIPPTSATAKARVDGEDLLTPLVRRAAEAVAAAVARPAGR